MRATAPGVMTIIAMIVFVFVLQIFVGQEVVETLALSPSLIDAGEWWRVLTPILVHQGALHLFFNMYILFIYGPQVEQAFGTVRFVLMFLITGFMGSAFSYAFPPDNASVGASGAIFGVVGILVVYLYRRRRTSFMSQYLRGMGFFIIANFIFGLLPGMNVDNFAHLGGLVGGILLGLGFDRGESGEARSALPLQLVTALAVVALGAALVFL
jgi:rhomboid protease GluP